ncbi:hypothetical protein FE236_00395 [Mariprofundus erugo]|uniref:hypothetical protein n=1 Tax=Mariprofundus erugo TaxID=2528639 RepID=UPI0010FF20A1|nr:hypothetical protein [Mariprofundus erugo]TLS78253.1 hypothetical protein FE236_00395 [Mariprofundus erugo]
MAWQDVKGKITKWLKTLLWLYLLFISVQFARALHSTDQEKKVQGIFDQVKQLNDDQDHDDELISLYSRVLALYPEDKDALDGRSTGYVQKALTGRSESYERQGKLDLAEADLRKLDWIEQQDHDQAFAWHDTSLAWVLLLENKPNEAIEPAKRAWNRNYYDRSASAIFAHAILMAGDETSAAGRYLETCINITREEVNRKLYIKKYSTKPFLDAEREKYTARDERNDVLEQIDTLIGKGFHVESFNRAKVWINEFNANADALYEAQNYWISGNEKAKQHQYAEAIQLFEQAESQYKSILGEQHPACIDAVTIIESGKEKAEKALNAASPDNP